MQTLNTAPVSRSAIKWWATYPQILCHLLTFLYTYMYMYIHTCWKLDSTGVVGSPDFSESSSRFTPTLSGSKYTTSQGMGWRSLPLSYWAARPLTSHRPWCLDGCYAVSYRRWQRQHSGQSGCSTCGWGQNASCSQEMRHTWVCPILNR